MSVAIGGFTWPGGGGFSFPPRRVNVAGHLLTFLPEETAEHDGVKLTSPARTWLDLASVLKLEDLVAAGDSLVCSHGAEFPEPKDALCSIEELREIVGRHPGMRGVRTARAALELIRVARLGSGNSHAVGFDRREPAGT